jgi:hypothetical protein
MQDGLASEADVMFVSDEADRTAYGRLTLESRSASAWLCPSEWIGLDRWSASTRFFLAVSAWSLAVAITAWCWSCSLSLVSFVFC